MDKTKKLNIRSLRELLLVGVVMVLCVVWTILNPQFMSFNNISNILRQGSYIAYCGCRYDISHYHWRDRSFGWFFGMCIRSGRGVCLQKHGQPVISGYCCDRCWDFGGTDKWCTLCHRKTARFYCISGQYDCVKRVGIYCDRR